MTAVAKKQVPVPVTQSSTQFRAIPRPNAKEQKITTSMRPKAETIVATVPPPAAGSRMPSSIDLLDSDIVAVAPAPRSSAPPPVPSNRPSQPPRASSLPPRPVSVAPRASVTPISSAPRSMNAVEKVREAIGELELLASTWQAAGVCCGALARALGARAVIIHSHDGAKSEIRIIATWGEPADGLMGASALVEDDFLASTVICNGKPLTMPVEGELPRLAPDRLRAMGASASVVAAPVMVGTEVRAMIELVDPKGASVTIGAAVEYAAAQLGKYLASQKK